MKSAILFFGVASLLSTSLFLSDARAEHNAAAAATAQAGDVPQRGTLYRIRHRGNTSYLFGTIHVGTPAFAPLDATATAALMSASTLVLEIDVRNNQPFQHALQRHGMYRNGDTLEQHLSSDTLLQLKHALQEFDIALDHVSRMKPWLVANMLIGLALERQGYQRQHGIEYLLLSIAERQTKAVQEIESAEYQMSLFDSMTDAIQEQYLLEHLAELNDGNALKKAKTLIDAWARADGAAVENWMRAALLEKTASADFTRRILLDKRNPEMANRIEALLKDEKSAFVGVGLLHLIGENGLPTLLRQRGYEVEKLY